VPSLNGESRSLYIHSGIDGVIWSFKHKIISAYIFCGTQEDRELWSTYVRVLCHFLRSLNPKWHHPINQSSISRDSCWLIPNATIPSSPYGSIRKSIKCLKKKISLYFTTFCHVPIKGDEVFSTGPVLGDLMLTSDFHCFLFVKNTNHLFNLQSCHHQTSIGRRWGHLTHVILSELHFSSPF
jgi:hypothetical protein